MSTWRIFISTLREMPTWFVLLIVLGVLLTGYYIRPDNVTEDAIKSVAGALLLSLQHNKPLPPPPTP